MRQRTTRMILAAILVVAVMMGVPGAAMAGVLVWNSHQNALGIRAETIARAADRRLEDGLWVTQSTISVWGAPGGDEPAAHTEVNVSGRYRVVSGGEISGPRLHSQVYSPSRVRIEMSVSAYPAILDSVVAVGMFALGALVALAIGWALAHRMARRLSAPLIYLAAQAEQIGSGQVRAQLRPSGVEEIDLVQEELVRTGERMAGRLAAERQRSADASHQLRSPLTALSMRLEEIELITDDPEVREEVVSALGQVERLTLVVEELLDDRRRTQGSTEALHILEVFNAQREEWEEQFIASDRELRFLDEAERPILAEAGKISQVLATLIENSLRYGGGTTTVRARPSTSSRGVVIEVSDEGPGVDPAVGDEIFEMGYSGHGSSGIGLALAKDLSNSMGARLELSSNQPIVFSLSLAAVPSNFDPDIVMPPGPLVSTGRRWRGF